MADISMCQDEKCQLRDKCWRFNAPACPVAQCYGDFAYGKYDVNGNGCDFYWEMEIE